MANYSFTDPEGEVWDSRYEWEVYDGIRKMGLDVRRCSAEQGDSIDYASNVVRGYCMECEGVQVVQKRTYTPDLFVSEITTPDGGRGSYIEVKGYWKPAKRSLLRSVLKSNPDTPLVFVFQNDGWITRGKSKYSDYIKRYFKTCRMTVWKNKLKKVGDPIPQAWLQAT